MPKKECSFLRKLRRCDELRRRVGEKLSCLHKTVSLSYWCLDKASAIALSSDDNHSDWSSISCQAVTNKICCNKVIVSPAMLFFLMESTTAELSHIKSTLHPVHSSAHNVTAKKTAYISFQLMCFLRCL